MENMRQIPLEETKKHGDVLFPFNIYPCTIPRDFPSVALHWHRDMELIYIKKNSLTAQLGMRSEAVSQRDICIVPPGTLHGLRCLNGQSAEYENIIFDPELLGSGAADLCARKYLVPLSAGQLLQPVVLRPGMEGYAAAEDCLAQAEKLCEKKPAGFEMGVKAAMLQLLFHLVQIQTQMPDAEPSGTARLKHALAFIQKEYVRPLDVEEMAAYCGFSPSHFMRWFRSMTGSSFVGYLNEYRLAEAAQRLRGTDEKILAIAQDVGFSSLSNFNHQFRIRYGVSPREYRKG